MSHHYAKVTAYDQDHQDFDYDNDLNSHQTGGFTGPPPTWTTIATTTTTTSDQHPSTSTSSTTTSTTIQTSSGWTEVQGREDDDASHQQETPLFTVPMTPRSTTSLQSHLYHPSSSPSPSPRPARQLRSSPSQRPRSSPSTSTSRSPGGGGGVNKSWRQQTQQSLRRMILNPFLSLSSSSTSSSSSSSLPSPLNSSTAGAYTLIRDASLSTETDGGAPSSSSSSSSTSAITTTSTIIDNSASHPVRIPPPRSSTRPPTNNAVDGVFANIPAKPEVEGQKDDERRPPTYESAVQDVTPPYFEMTVFSSSSSGSSVFGDEILVDGLPVGNIFQFFWNIAVAICFQFLGVLLTYLLHNSHASRCGSMAGLGITLINFGIGMRGGFGTILGNDSPPYNSDSTYVYNPSIGEVTQITKYPSMDDTGYIGAPASSASGSSSPYGGYGYGYGANADSREMDWLQTDLESHWVSMVLMMAGWMVLVKALAEYAIAKRTENIIKATPDDEEEYFDEEEEQELEEMHTGGSGRVVGYMASEDDV
ncbi:MAG: hypothetical protein J3R72DRAFT_87382 [Linnemannia gamsii]|nr:MAG: hypothetical protein J3R72DRAFT_87382 [Linnemannia gamsii]